MKKRQRLEIPELVQEIGILQNVHMMKPGQSIDNVKVASTLNCVNAC